MSDSQRILYRGGPDRRPFALLVIGVAAFTLYGSLVPFDFRARPLGDTLDAFIQIMAGPVMRDSRSDAVANVMLGIPLGFGLLGFCRVGTIGLGRDLLVAAVLLPGCLLFASAVEFSQLFVPVRTSSKSDVLCQGFGAVIGMAGWVLAGRWLTAQAWAVWQGPRIGGATGRVLAGYVLLLAFVQFLPMDLSASPRDLYRKLRDVVIYVPFAEVLDASGDQLPNRIGRLIQVFGLYLPVGLLAAGLPGRFWRVANFPRLLAVAVLLACVMEGLQLVVQSRVPSATDVVVGTFGALAGWLVRRWRPAGLAAGEAIAFGAVWLAMLAVPSWEPFTVRPAGEALPFDWIPGMPLESGNPLFALEEMITKVILFSLFGVLVAECSCGRGRAVLFLPAAVLGLFAAVVFEAGQTVIGSHTPCITDVLIGGFGAYAGAWVANRARVGEGFSSSRMY